MHAEDMDLRSYPVKVVQSPDGNSYPEPKPASHVWKINYTNSAGVILHEFYKSEMSSPVAEIPGSEIRIIEKRMIKPHKIVGVFFGLLYEQQEPNGEWVKPYPQDKDPRPEKFIEGEFTKLYMEDWRKRAYEGHFDTLKLTRAYSKEAAQAAELTAQKQELEKLKQQLAIKEQNEKMLREKLAQSGRS